MPGQIYDIPLTNGTSVPAEDIVNVWDIWSFFAEEDPKNPTPITGLVVVLGLIIVASFALLNALFIIFLANSITKKRLRPREDNSSECTGDQENDISHSEINFEQSFSSSTLLEIENM